MRRRAGTWLIALAFVGAFGVAGSADQTPLAVGHMLAFMVLGAAAFLGGLLYGKDEL